MTLEQIARKSGKDPERVQKLLDEMSVIGMIEYNWEKRPTIISSMSCRCLFPAAQNL